jgi:DNA polymerase III subunit gamma/tau
VSFEEILNQLKDLSGRENIEADDDALALLAEAGDGSMRDALSILDQAIASSTGRLTADQVRNLVGAAPSGVLEEVMQAVAQGSSETVLRLVDKLISEGHSPTHFARQMVRFLRNAVVARVAGADSSLLQISSDERQRVARIAALFEEEDLARYLQIMLRTHSELGYRQEQRFHLELGLLKMAHAARLLPLEQLLSESTGAVAQRPVGKPSNVSPFAADSARKSGSKSELSAENVPLSGSQTVAGMAAPSVVMGSAAPAAVMQQAPPEMSLETKPVVLEKAVEKAEEQPVEFREAVLNALSNANQRILVNMLETAEWKLEGNEVVIKVASSATVIEMSLGPDARRLMIATASGALGRAIKLRVIPGGVAQAVVRPTSASGNGGGRGRAEQDPVVQRMKEKFGAEIRTIIDYKEKR